MLLGSLIACNAKSDQPDLTTSVSDQLSNEDLMDMLLENSDMMMMQSSPTLRPTYWRPSNSMTRRSWLAMRPRQHIYQWDMDEEMLLDDDLDDEDDIEHSEELELEDASWSKPTRCQILCPKPLQECLQQPCPASLKAECEKLCQGCLPTSIKKDEVKEDKSSPAS